MNALTFKIELQQPLLVTQLGSHDENSAQSMEYIPGSVLRNALAALYIRKHNLDDAAADPTCRSLFFEGRVRFLNSYRADRLGNRSLPTPLSWIIEKDAISCSKEKSDEPLFFYDASLDPSAIRQLGNVKSLESQGRFCRLDDDGVELIRPARQVTVHIQRLNKRRLDSKADSQVFVYDALAEGEVFCGAVIAPEGKQVEAIHNLLLEMPELQIGGSRTAGYGRIRFYDLQQHSNWREVKDIKPDDQEDVLIVTLLSDAIICDQNGQYVADLEPAVGVPCQHCFRRIKPVGGFNRKWGLPLPQAYAIQAGSVFVYSYSPELKKKLADLVEMGIGERLQDGFGRIALNWNLKPELTVYHIVTEPSLTAISLKDDPLSHAIAQRIVEHKLRKQLDQAIQRQVLLLNISGGSRAALSRVRLMARRSVLRRDLVLLKDLIANLKKTGRDNLDKTRIKTIKLYDWLKERLEKRDIEEQLGVSMERLPQVGDVRAQLTDGIKNEYTARWIEAVVKRAYKEVSHE